MENELPKIVNQVIGRAIVISLIQAVFLRIATRWLTKVNLPYGKAYGYTVVIAIVGGLFMILPSLLLNQFPLSYPVATIISTLLALIVSLALSSSIYATAIKIDGDKPIGVRKGILISLVQLGLALAATVILIALIVGIGHLLK